MFVDSVMVSSYNLESWYWIDLINNEVSCFRENFKNNFKPQSSPLRYLVSCDSLWSSIRLCNWVQNGSVLGVTCRILGYFGVVIFSPLWLRWL